MTNQDKLMKRIAVEDMMASDGWKLLDKELKKVIEVNKQTMKVSDEPNIIFSCSKKNDGLSYIYEIANSFIKFKQ